VKKYKFKALPLKKKFIFLYLCFVITPTLVFACALIILALSNVRSTIYANSQSNFTQTQQLVTYFMNNANYYMNTYLNDDKLHEIIECDNSTRSMQDQISDMMYLRSLTASYRSKSEINDICLYIENEALYIGDESAVQTITSIESTSWYQYAQYSFPEKSIVPSSYFENGSIISLIKPVRSSVNYANTIGLIRFDIKVSQLETLLGEFNAETDSYLYIVNAKGELITQNSDHGTEIPFDTLTLAADGEMHRLSIEKDQYLMYSVLLKDFDWYLVEVIPTTQITDRMLSQVLLYFVFFLLVLLLGLLFLRLFVKLFLNRIGSIKNHMSDVKNSLPPLLSDTKNNDEIDDLINAYNFMLTRMDELLREQYALGNQIRTAEMKALYEQINPHFLYNTLAMINWLAEDGDIENVTKVIGSLSSFYKLCLNKGNAYITLDEEIQIIDSFLYIQKMRFGTDIRIEYHMDTALRSLIIPKLTLQPLIENALVHGILMKQKKDGVIRLSVDSSPSIYRIKITDDGVGIPSDLVMKLNQGSYPSTLKHYGIYNILKRLNIFFGSGCTLFYESTAGKGTTATLTLPRKEEAVP